MIDKDQRQKRLGGFGSALPENLVLGDSFSQAAHGSLILRGPRGFSPFVVVQITAVSNFVNGIQRQ